MLVAASPHRDQQRQVWSNAMGVARCAYKVKAGGYEACPRHDGLKRWRERIEVARSNEERCEGALKWTSG